MVMKWFFALNNQSPFFDEYATMCKVAVLSALEHTELEPYLVYDGEKGELTDWLEARGVNVIYARTRLYDDVRAIAEERNNPLILAIGAGTFLRTELPVILPANGIDDQYILYTDCDVMFCRDVTEQLSRIKPVFFAVAPEHDPKNYRRMNSGVMVMNLRGLRRHDRKFMEFSRRHMAEFTKSAFDQNAYRLFFRIARFTLWNHLPLELNWKPYWGLNPDAGIVHFHGPKPMHRQAFRDGTGYEPHQKWVAEAFFHYAEIWERYLESAAYARKVAS